MERAVVISYNWDTGQHYHTPFDGEGAGVKAMNWVHKSSFIWQDFPESEGWVHFMHCNPEAAKAKGAALTEAMFPSQEAPQRKRCICGRRFTLVNGLLPTHYTKTDDGTEIMCRGVR